MSNIKKRPIPEKYNRTGKWKALAEEAKVGDYFEVDDRNQAMSFAIRLREKGFKPTTRKLEDDRYGVWILSNG